MSLPGCEEENICLVAFLLLSFGLQSQPVVKGTAREDASPLPCPLSLKVHPLKIWRAIGEFHFLVVSRGRNTTPTAPYSRNNIRYGLTLAFRLPAAGDAMHNMIAFFLRFRRDIPPSPHGSSSFFTHESGIDFFPSLLARESRGLGGHDSLLIPCFTIVIFLRPF